MQRMHHVNDDFPYPPAEIRLTLEEERFALCLLPTASSFADLGFSREPWSLLATRDERLVAAPESAIPTGREREGGYRAFRLDAAAETARESVVAALAGPLVAEEIEFYTIFAHGVSWLMVPEWDLPMACSALAEAGHEICAPHGGDPGAEFVHGRRGFPVALFVTTTFSG